MKKILTLLLILALSFTLFSCGNKESQEEESTQSEQTSKYDTPENDPTYIDPESDNYVTEEERLDEEKINEEEIDYSDIPYEEEETTDSEEELRASNGYSTDDIMNAKLPKSYTCETLNLETLEMTTAKEKKYSTGDKIVPELKDIDYQYVLDSKMTVDGMNYILTMAVVGDEIVRFQYTINLVKDTFKEVQVSSDNYTKVYTFKY